MKKIILAAIVIATAAVAAHAQKIKGSDTILPLSQKEAGNKAREVIIAYGG